MCYIAPTESNGRGGGGDSTHQQKTALHSNSNNCLTKQKEDRLGGASFLTRRMNEDVLYEQARPRRNEPCRRRYKGIPTDTLGVRKLHGHASTAVGFTWNALTA